MATKKRKEDDEVGSDKKRRKSGVAANGAELHRATSAAEEQQPIVSFLTECLPDKATTVTGWLDLRSLLDYGPKTKVIPFIDHLQTILECICRARSMRDQMNLVSASIGRSRSARATL